MIRIVVAHFLKRTRATCSNFRSELLDKGGSNAEMDRYLREALIAVSIQNDQLTYGFCILLC